jgi:hypothetical protein
MESDEQNSWTELQEDLLPQTQSERNIHQNAFPSEINETLQQDQSLSNSSSRSSGQNALNRNNVIRIFPQKKKNVFEQNYDPDNSFDNFKKHANPETKARTNSICIIDNIKLQKDSVRKRKTSNPYFQSFNVKVKEGNCHNLRLNSSKQVKEVIPDTSGEDSSEGSLDGQQDAHKSPPIKVVRRNDTWEMNANIFNSKLKSPKNNNLKGGLVYCEKVVTPLGAWNEELMEDVRDDLKLLDQQNKDLRSFHLWIRLKYYRKVVKKLKYLQIEKDNQENEFSLMLNLKPNFKFLGQHQKIFRSFYSVIEDKHLENLSSEIRTESFERTFSKTKKQKQSKKREPILKKLKTMVTSFKKTQQESQVKKIKATEINVALHETKHLLSEFEDSLKKCQMYLSFGNDKQLEKMEIQLDSKVFQRYIIQYLVSKVSQNIGGFTSKMLKIVLFSLISNFIKINTSALAFLIPDLKIPKIEEKIFNFMQKRFFNEHSKKIHFILLKFNSFLSETIFHLNSKLDIIYKNEDIFKDKDFELFQKTSIELLNCLEEIEVKLNQKDFSNLNHLCQLSGMDLKLEINEYLANQEDYVSKQVHFDSELMKSLNRNRKETLDDSYLLDSEDVKDFGPPQKKKKTKNKIDEIKEFKISDSSSPEVSYQKGNIKNLSVICS